MLFREDESEREIGSEFLVVKCYLALVSRVLYSYFSLCLQTGSMKRTKA